MFGYFLAAISVPRSKYDRGGEEILFLTVLHWFVFQIRPGLWANKSADETRTIFLDLPQKVLVCWSQRTYLSQPVPFQTGSGIG